MHDGQFQIGVKEKPCTKFLRLYDKNNTDSTAKIIKAIPGLKEKLKSGTAKELGFVKDGKVVKKDIKLDNKLWAVIDPLLGRTSEENIAEFFQLPLGVIENRRLVLRIEKFNYIDPQIIDALLQYGTNEEIEKLFDNSKKRITKVNVALQRLFTRGRRKGVGKVDL